MATRDALPITDGPSKFDLMLSIFDGKQVTFRSGSQQFAVYLMSVEKEDGSHDMWNITGNICGEFNNKVRGHYSTKRRAGHLHFISQ